MRACLEKLKPNKSQIFFFLISGIRLKLEEEEAHIKWAGGGWGAGCLLVLVFSNGLFSKTEIHIAGWLPTVQHAGGTVCESTIGLPALVPAGSQCHMPVLWGSSSKQPWKAASGGRGGKASHRDKSGTIQISTIPKDPCVKGFVPRSWHWCKLEEEPLNRLGPGISSTGKCLLCRWSGQLCCCLMVAGKESGSLEGGSSKSLPKEYKERK